jgi:hypothetical protein
MRRFAQMVAGTVAIALAVALTGCAPQTIYVPQKVLVPTPVSCVKDIPPPPVLAVSTVEAVSPNGETVKAYVETIIQLEGDDSLLRESLKLCAKPLPNS